MTAAGWTTIGELVGLLLASYGVLRESFQTLAAGRPYGEGRYGEGTYGGQPSRLTRFVVGAATAVGLLPGDRELTATDRKRNAALAVIGVVIGAGSLTVEILLAARIPSFIVSPTPLNVTSEAIQAGAAVAGVLVTVVLVVITWKYMQLTRILAGIATRQLTHAEAAINEKWRELWAAGKRMGGILEQLPDRSRHETFDRDIRAIALWEPSMIDEFQRMAAHLGAPVGDRAAGLAQAMLWLRDRVERVQQVLPQTGYDYGRHFSFDEWYAKLAVAWRLQDEIMQLVGKRLHPTNP
ncbi:MAG TPA: hypothetical protein VGI92_05140 [Gemmatimonadales bacterium]|jgi:hypothetical protein